MALRVVVPMVGGTGLPRVWGRPFPQVNQEHPHPGHRPSGTPSPGGCPPPRPVCWRCPEGEAAAAANEADGEQAREVRSPAALPDLHPPPGISATPPHTPVLCPRAPPPLAAPILVSGLPPALPPPRRFAHPAPRGLFASSVVPAPPPSGPHTLPHGAVLPHRLLRGFGAAPLLPSQITGKGRAAPRQGPRWGWAGGSMSILSPVGHPRDIQRHQGEWLRAAPRTLRVSRAQRP